MKTFINFFIYLLISTFSIGQISDQIKENLKITEISASYSSSVIEKLEHLGIDQTAHLDSLILEATNFKSQFGIASDSIKVYDYNAYSISTYVNKVDGLNASEKNLKDYIAENEDYYVLFVSRYSTAKFIEEIVVYHNLPGHQLSTQCENYLPTILALANSNVQLKYEKSNYDAFGANESKLTFFATLNSKLNSSCEVDGEEQIPYLVDIGFDHIPIPGINMVYESELGNYNAVPNERDKDHLEKSTINCTVIDYSQGNLRYEVGDDLVEFNDMLVDALAIDNPEARVLLITYEDILANGPEFLETIKQAEQEDQVCKNLIIVYFPGHFKSGEDEVCIYKYDRDVNPSNEVALSLSYQEYFDKYINDEWQIAKIDFRFKTFKNDLINFCSGLNSSLTGIEVCTEEEYFNSDPTLNDAGKIIIQGYCEYQMGLVSGFGDGFIETVDFVSVALQYLTKKYIEFQENNPTSVFFWKDVIAYTIEKKSFYEAISHKWNETWDYWVGNVEGVVKFFDKLYDNIVLLYNAMKVMVKKWVSDATFQNGSFDAGYAHGIAIFEIAIEIVLAAFTGGTGNVAKGMATFVKAAGAAGDDIVSFLSKQIKDIKPSDIGSKADELAEYFAKHGKLLSKRVWNYIDELSQQIFDAVILPQNRLNPALVYAGYNGTVNTLQDYRNAGDWIVKASKNGDLPPSGKGKLHEISTGDGGIIYHDPVTPGKRGLAIIAEETADKSKLVAVILESLPANCKEALQKYSTGLLKDLGTKGNDGKTLMSKINNPRMLRGMEALADQPFAIRTNPDFLEIAGRHLDETGQTSSSLKKEIAAADGFHPWRNDIVSNFTGDKALFKKKLKDYGFPHSSNAVHESARVSEFNKKHLDIDPEIPNAVADYTLVREVDGVTYTMTKGSDSWEVFFAKVKAHNHFNGFDSHHMFPVNLFKRESFRKWYELHGKQIFSMNGKDGNLENLIMLEKKTLDPPRGVHAKHDTYTDKIGDHFDEKYYEYLQTHIEDDALDLLTDDILDLRENLKPVLLDKSVLGQTEINSMWDIANGGVDFETLIN